MEPKCAIRGLLTKIYAYKFFEDFVLIYPLYAVMFTDRGMEAWQVGTLLSVWSVTAFFLEVPSGVWADKYSRKRLLFGGQLIRAIGYLWWFFFPGFWGFTVGFVCWGIESATSSGTFQALVYDELKHLGREREFTRVIGRTNSIGLIAIVFASILASPAVLLGYPTVILLSSGAVLAAGLIILTLPETRKVDSTRETNHWAILRTGINEVLQNAYLLRLLLFLALATALPGALDEYWTIFADRAGTPKYGLGIFLAVLAGAEALGSFWAYRLENFKEPFFYFIFFGNGLVLIAAAYWFNVPALMLLIFFSFSFTMVQIVFEGRLQHAIASESRATVSSVSGFLTEIGALSVFFSFGWLAQSEGYRMGFLAYGVIIALTGLGYLLIRRNQVSGTSDTTKS